MTRSKKFIATAAALFAIFAAGWLFFYIRDYDTRELRRLVTELEETAAKRPGRSNALALLDAATPERIFAPQISVRSDHPAIERTFKVKEFGQLLLSMKKSCRSAALDFNIESIVINGEQAEISGDALFSGSSDKGSFREVRMVTLGCLKVGGSWKISAITLSRIISR